MKRNKREIEERDYQYERNMEQKAMHDKEMDLKLTKQRLKDIKDKQMREKFRIEAEKNLYKIQILDQMMEKEETKSKEAEPKYK